MISRRLTLGLLAGSVATPAIAAPRARLLDARWQKFGTSGDPDHDIWRDVLRTHLRESDDGINRFNYKAASSKDVASYVSTMSKIDPVGLTSSAAFAYWVNLYNALTVQVVLSNYPVSTIRDIGGGLFSTGPWSRKLIKIAGQHLSLDDIEHGILRPVWRTPLVHYAVNCASLGCPNLAEKPFTSTNLKQALTKAARDYINHPRGARIEGGALIVSSIYDWFKSDFGSSDANIIMHLQKYARPELAKALTEQKRISGFEYDWQLNG